MVAARLLAVVVAGLLVTSSDTWAKDHGKHRGSDRRDNGPAFCRSGAGHPVFGWRWCEERGWDRSGFWDGDRDRGRNRAGRRDDDDDRDERNSDRRARSRFPWPF